MIDVTDPKAVLIEMEAYICRIARINVLLDALARSPDDVETDAIQAVADSLADVQQPMSKLWNEWFDTVAAETNPGVV